MGCCEGKNDYKFSKASEIPTRRENELIKQFNSYNNNVEPHQTDSLQSQPNLDYDNEIPQTKDVKIPPTKLSLAIIQSKKHLKLTIIESKYLTEGRVLVINPGGLIGSERNAQDGITIFGTRNYNYINDFDFPEEENNMGERLFEIKYDLLSDDYKMKNLAGSGLYIKIMHKIPLKNNLIFSISSSLIIVTISNDFVNRPSLPNEDIINSVLHLKVLHGENQGLERSFESKKQQIVKFGRFKTSEIDLDFMDESISRLQTTIFYDNNNWFIIDGDGEKQSQNGTWYFADEYASITEGMIFRLGGTLFMSHLYTPKKKQY